MNKRENLDSFIKNNAIINQSYGCIECICCGYKVKNNDKNRILLMKIHLKTKKHFKNCVNFNKNNNGSDMNSRDNFNKSNFFYDLTKVFLILGIPLTIVSKQPLIELFQNYFNIKLPHYNTLRRNYVNKIYQDYLENIRNTINGKKLYFITDETKNKRYVN